VPATTPKERTRISVMNDYKVDMGLEGKVALITGGARNIGRHTALALARTGVKVAVVARTDSDLLKSATDECAKYATSVAVAADIADPEALASAVDRIEAELGPVDILVNNAGVRPRMSIADVTLQDWQEVIDTNLRAPFLLIQRLVGGMMDRRWGRIINVSGIDALNGSIDRVPVTTTKGGLLGLTASVTPQVAKYGVTVNNVVPGAINTDRHTPEWYPALQNETFYRSNIDRHPMARWGTSDEVANVILFLSSQLASFMTGQTLIASGGFPFDRRKESEAEPELDWVGLEVSAQ
jgi:3-oxoacyl-[acyl-carrier protein] reductase